MRELEGMNKVCTWMQNHLNAEELKSLGMENSNTHQSACRALKGLAFCSTLEGFRVGFDDATPAVRSCQIYSAMALGPGKPKVAHDCTLGHGSLTEDLGDVPWSLS